MYTCVAFCNFENCVLENLWQDNYKLKCKNLRDNRNVGWISEWKQEGLLKCEIFIPLRSDFQCQRYHPMIYIKLWNSVYQDSSSKFWVEYTNLFYFKG